MKVKVRKRKKSPAPVTEEQALLKELDSSNPYTFFVVRELIRNEELRKKFLAFVEQHKLDENDICGNAPSSQFLTHDVGGRGHRNKELSSIAANQTSSGVYVPRIFIDYISGSFNDNSICQGSGTPAIRLAIDVDSIEHFCCPRHDFTKTPKKNH